MRRIPSLLARPRARFDTQATPSCGWRLPSFGLVGLLALASGCTGSVGAPEGPSTDFASVNGSPTDGSGSAADGDPGRVTLHRLNRAEYNNTVRDLLGTTLSP